MAENNDKSGEGGINDDAPDHQADATEQDSGHEPQAGDADSSGADASSGSASGETSAGEIPGNDGYGETSGVEAFDPVAEREAQIDELTKRLTLAHADIQNLHRRYDREKAEMAKFAITKFASDIANVADNFERAIFSVPEDATLDNPVLKSLLDGVTMTEREFLNVLERHGVKRVAPVGDLFDPHKHQAVAEETDASVAAGTVLKVFQSGYMIEERVLRPAMVVVAKGGMKAAKAPVGDFGDSAGPETSAVQDDDGIAEDDDGGVDG